MIIQFKKISYSDLPEVVQNAIKSYDGDTITVDDTGLTAAQKTKLGEWFEQQGYKQV